MLSHGELQLSPLLPMWRTARQSADRDGGFELDYVSVFTYTFKQPEVVNTRCGGVEI